MADGGGRAGVCAGRRICIRIRRRPRYRPRLALRWDACCDACDACNACSACNAWLHKERGPCNPDGALAGPVSTFSRFSLLPPGTTSLALCAHHITHLAAIPCRHPPTSLSRRHRPETLLLCSSCPAAGAAAAVSHLPSWPWPWPWQRARGRVRVRVVCVLVLVLVLVRVLYQSQEPAQLVT
jgi:hypothetical protein